MAWFEGSYEHTVVVPGSVDKVAKHFADLSTIIAQTSDVERSNIEGDVIHFVLKAQDHAGIAKFQGDYRCRYTLSGDTLRWETLEGNTQSSGTAKFTASGADTSVDYRETVKIDMDVPAMMAPMLRPLITQVLAHEIKGYVNRMIKSNA